MSNRIPQLVMLRMSFSTQEPPQKAPFSGRTPLIAAAWMFLTRTTLDVLEIGSQCTKPNQVPKEVIWWASSRAHRVILIVIESNLKVCPQRQSSYIHYADSQMRLFCTRYAEPARRSHFYSISGTGSIPPTVPSAAASTTSNVPAILAVAVAVAVASKLGTGFGTG